MGELSINEIEVSFQQDFIISRIKTNKKAAAIKTKHCSRKGGLWTRHLI
jgi:hypothetical protein